jgi:hypothetical protein
MRYMNVGKPDLSGRLWRNVRIAGDTSIALFLQRLESKKAAFGYRTKGM